MGPIGVVGVGRYGHDLARVAVVGRDDEQRVGVRAGEVDTDLDRAIECDGLADLPARVGGVILLVDRGAFDLEKEPRTSRPIQELDGLCRHLGERRLAGRPVVLATHLWLRDVRRVGKRLSRRSTRLSCSRVANNPRTLRPGAAAVVRLVAPMTPVAARQRVLTRQSVPLRSSAVRTARRRRPSARQSRVRSAARAIEPGPPALFLSCGQAAMSAGPWHVRLATCAARTAGVASVNSAVVTSPVRMPRSWAISRIVFRS